MAKRGRPTTYDKYIKWSEDVGDIPFSHALDFAKQIDSAQDPDKSQRWRQTRCYSTMMYIVGLESEAASEIPYYDELQKHDGIMEQFGRMAFQDGYKGAMFWDLVFEAAEAYHNGYKAKEIEAWIRNIRKTGISEDQEGGTT